MNYTQCGSALALPYADGIAQTCVTSPPYYGLRDYGTARWEGGNAGCDHKQTIARHDGGRVGVDGFHGSASADSDKGAVNYRDICGKCGARRIDSQIGLEQTPAAYVAQIVAAMREVWRVLRDDGTLFINLGDSYAQSETRNRQGQGGAIGSESMTRVSLHETGRKQNHGLKPKDLMGIPWRVAFALQDDGWYLRSDIIWAKPNPMPESVTDRPTKAHEYVFLLAKQPRYYYDAEAIAEPSGGANGSSFVSEYDRETKPGLGMGERKEAATRNARSVWQIATQPYSGAHFATMPPELARRCILAGSSARGQCPKCGAPWTRVVERTAMVINRSERTHELGQTRSSGTMVSPPTHTTTGWAASCDCDAGDPVPQIVLDPFAGSGTTAMVALQNGRQAIGTELNPKYLRLQDDRTQVTIGLGMVLA